MQIERAEVIVTSPGRNFVTLKLTTDDGVTGSATRRSTAASSRSPPTCSEHVVPLLIGRDAHRIEDTWQYLYRGAYWRRGPVTMAAIAAVDMALWDIKGKVAGHAGLPAARRREPRRACSPTATPAAPTCRELFDSIREHLDARLPGDPRPDRRPRARPVYGVASGGGAATRYDYEPARAAAAPAEEDWDTAAYLRHLPAVFEAVRNEFGPELPLLHDGHHRMTPDPGGASSARRWSRTTCSGWRTARRPRTRRRCAWSASTPRRRWRSARSSTRSGTTRTLITEQLIDYVRSAVTHTGGITPMRGASDFAALYQIKSGMHGPTDISPVGMAAALHLGLAIHNFGIQEYMQHSDATDEVFQHDLHVRRRAACTPASARPGRRARRGARPRRTRTAPAYLPYNRLLDGTVHDW